MKLIVSYEWPVTFVLRCRCGFSTPARATLEAAGRDADLHMAEKFPIGTIRRPCDPLDARPLPPVRHFANVGVPITPQGSKPK
jgi:hypothetical protein